MPFNVGERRCCLLSLRHRRQTRDMDKTLQLSQRNSIRISLDAKTRKLVKKLRYSIFGDGFFVLCFVCAQGYPVGGQSQYGKSIRKAYTLCIYDRGSMRLKCLGLTVHCMTAANNSENDKTHRLKRYVLSSKSEQTKRSQISYPNALSSAMKSSISIAKQPVQKTGEPYYLQARTNLKRNSGK